MRAGARLLVSAILAAAAGTCAAQANVPVGHPRLWLGSDTQRAAAATWLSQTSERPRSEDHAGNAFLYAVAGDTSRCAAPVQWLLQFTLPDLDNVSSDNARWYGETAALVFDWCHDVMTAGQRQLVIDRWNTYLDVLHAKPWGGRGFAENNYFWGYLRNSLEWAIATWHENPRAPDHYRAAVETRYRTWFQSEHAEGLGKGGVPGEGTQYGRYMLGYTVVPFLSLREFGVELYSETDYYRSALYYLTYSTTPSLTPAPASVANDCPDRYWYLSPFNDDETFVQCEPESARGSDLGMFALAMSEVGSEPTRGRASLWFHRIVPQLPYWARFRAPSQPAMPPDERLPADFFARGPGFLWAKGGAADDVALHLQLGAHGNVGHRHHDVGSFQLWGLGEWGSRETTGYSDLIRGYAGQGSVDVLNSVAHNAVMFEGRGERAWTSGGPRHIPAGTARGENPDGLANVLRVHHDQDFLFAAVDLSAPYRAARSSDPCRYDWPFAERVVREFLFLRRAGVLLVFDRLLSGADSLDYTDAYCHSVGFSSYSGPRLNAENVRKAVMFHLDGTVERNGRSVISSLRNRVTRVETLLPATPITRLIDERLAASSVGQQRVEVESSGTALTEFLHVVQVHAAGAPQATATLQALPGGWRVSVQKPGSPEMTVDLLAGTESEGGSVTIGARRVPLLERVQGFAVTPEGPVWEVLGESLEPSLFTDGFE